MYKRLSELAVSTTSCIKVQHRSECERPGAILGTNETGSDAREIRPKEEHLCWSSAQLRLREQRSQLHLL